MYIQDMDLKEKGDTYIKLKNTYVYDIKLNRDN